MADEILKVIGAAAAELETRMIRRILKMKAVAIASGIFHILLRPEKSLSSDGDTYEIVLKRIIASLLRSRRMTFMQPLCNLINFERKRV